MKERILEFLRRENKTSALLAEEIGVQPSGISHILSGRNNPSLDFVIKMLEKYIYLSPEWLLFGKGKMYKESQNPSLFDQEEFPDDVTDSHKLHVPEANHYLTESREQKQEDSGRAAAQSVQAKEVTRIVWFYDDKSFDIFIPGR